MHKMRRQWHGDTDDATALSAANGEEFDWLLA
jgi:hypothetical protein